MLITEPQNGLASNGIVLTRRRRGWAWRRRRPSEARTREQLKLRRARGADERAAAGAGGGVRREKLGDLAHLARGPLGGVRASRARLLGLGCK